MAAREAEVGADGRRTVRGREKSQVISIVYEFGALFRMARHLRTNWVRQTCSGPRLNTESIAALALERSSFEFEA